MQLYVIGYPQLATDSGQCAVNVQLNKSELKFAASTVDYLNKSIKKAAAAAHLPYVDISKALYGHRLCETASYNVAVNGLTAGKDAGPLGIKVLGKESFHPNALGHVLIEQTILNQTHNFTAALPNDSPGDDSELLNAPVSGRPVNTLVPDQNLTDWAGKRGTNISVHASGADDGLRASTVYTVRLDGAVGNVLGSITSDSTGDVQGSVTIPANTPPGGHTIDITGENQGGEPVDVTRPIYVPDSDADSDGDGIEDITDSCPGAINSGQDSDADGTDDICDNLIGQLSSPAPPTTGSGKATGAVSVARSPRATGLRNNVLGVTKNPHTFRWHAAALFAKSSSLYHAAGSQAHRNVYLLLLLILFGVCGLIFLRKRYIQKVGFQLQWGYMSRVRKGFIYLLSLLLLATLLGTAVSTSTNNTLGKPKKVEQYLSESKLYDHFIAYTADQAKKTNGDNDQTDSVSLSDAAVQTAAQASFSPKLIENSVNTVIDSNYAWLEGKTATPTFKVDLSSQKQTFAQKVGQYVTTYTAGLPVCANDQVALQQSTDPLAATCRPAALAPEAAGAQVTQRLSTTGDFLSNPVVTASSINPDAKQQTKPYYVKLGHLPKAYQLGQKLPYILAVLSVLFALGIIFLSTERRKGVRKVGIVLLIAGLALVVVKFSADLVFRKAENRVFSSASVGQLQQSLTDFAHRIETSVIRTELWFGIGFLLLAAIIFGVLAATRNKDNNPGSSTPALFAEDPPKDDSQTPLVLARKRLKRSPNGPKLGGQPPAAPAPKPKKPPRLVQ